MSDRTVTSIGFDKLEQLILENQRLREQNKALILEKQKLLNENMNIKFKLRDKKVSTDLFSVELISEHKGVFK
jgi:hypothetical protein